MSMTKTSSRTFYSVLVPVLVLIVGISVLFALILVVWLAILLVNPINDSLGLHFEKPTYAAVKIDWYPYAEVESSTKVEIDNRELLAVFVTLDDLYGLVGRDEQPFSENPELLGLAADLSTGFPAGVRQEKWRQEFFRDLRAFASELANDNALKRIADGQERTRTILTALRSYHHWYTDELNMASAKAHSESLTLQAARGDKIRLYLQVLAAIALTLLASSTAVLIFRIRSDVNSLRVKVERREKANETS